MSKLKQFRLGNSSNIALFIGGVLAFIAFLSTLQLTINGSSHPYMTDVGNIQNALPRWGTIHFPGYPLYTLSGSIFVTLARVIGIEPAISASLLSAIFGAISVALLISLELQFKVPISVSIVTAILFALSTSFWVDASIAEIHTLTILLMMATLIFSVRFSRSGYRADLLWLSLFFSQALLHQRALIFMVPGILLLVVQQRSALWRGLPYVVAIGFLSSLVYLYLPIRDWQGSDWTFNQPGTWQGFWTLALDTKTERIIALPTSIDQWVERTRDITNLLAGEWPLWLLILGLFGNLAVFMRGRPLEAIALFLIWFPFLILSLLIWEGRLSDALLAVNLPVVAMSAFGLGLFTAEIIKRAHLIGTGITVLWIGLALYLFVDKRPNILVFTRDPSAESVIKVAEKIEPAVDGQPITLMALWGNDYWALAYAQSFQGRIPNLQLVDHNADLEAIMNSSGHLLTLSKTFYLRPLSWWDERYSRVFLSGYSPDIVEIDTEPILSDPELKPTKLADDIGIKSTELEWLSTELLQLTIIWEAIGEPKIDYSVAVHLVSHVPPLGPDDIIAQADSQHPVNGWYPTGRWKKGELIQDIFILEIPQETEPQAVRIGMYYLAEDGKFVNTEWLTLPLAKE